MTENNETSTTASQDTAERTLSAYYSPPSPAITTVTLEAFPMYQGDAAIVRQVLPSADVRVELVHRRLEWGMTTWEDTFETVFRCTYPSLPPALEAVRHFQHAYVRTNIDVTTVVDLRELILLTCYHIECFLQVDRLLTRKKALDRGEEPTYVPCSYDELPWPDEFFGGLSDFQCVFYHLSRLAKLQSILGIERVRPIYDLMAAHPHPRARSDFELASLHVWIPPESMRRFYEEAAAEAESDFDFDFDYDLDFDLEAAEAQYAYEEWRHEEAWPEYDERTAASAAAEESDFDLDTEGAWSAYEEQMAARAAAEAEPDFDVHDAEDRT